MIKTPTVLVLGAGASQPYGLSTGGEIVDRVRHEAKDPGYLFSTLQNCGFSHEQIQQFFNQLSDSGQYSIDAFVQRHEGAPEVRKMAKAVLTACLLAQENEPALLSAPENHDWYRALFTGMFPASKKAFRNNRLDVVTLNFDRSFERRLYLMLCATYNINDKHEAAELAARYTPIHIHGTLGTPDWLPSADSSFDRAYGPQLTPETVLKCADQIHVIDDEIDPQKLSHALDLLQSAERIVFVGFSFHPDNMRRLDIGKLGQKTLHGTAKGMSPSDLSRTYAAINSARKNYLRDCSARQLMDWVEFFR